VSAEHYCFFFFMIPVTGSGPLGVAQLKISFGRWKLVVADIQLLAMTLSRGFTRVCHGAANCRCRNAMAQQTHCQNARALARPW
jgi:hypothetical protein